MDELMRSRGIIRMREKGTLCAVSISSKVLALSTKSKARSALCNYTNSFL